MPAGRPKVIAIARAFNQEALLPRWLDWMAQLADEMLVIDDGSWDGTTEILRAHPLVTELIVKQRSEQTECKDYNRLTKMAVERGAEWIVRFDTDEILDARIFDRLDELLAAKDVGEYRFRKFWLWRGEDQYRADRPEKFQNWNTARFFRAGPDLDWRHPEGVLPYRLAKYALRIASPRPQYSYRELAGLPGRVVEIDDVVLIHYAATEFGPLVWKHIRTALVRRKMRPRESNDQITDWAYSILDESSLQLEPVPEIWKPLLRPAGGGRVAAGAPEAGSAR